MRPPTVRQLFVRQLLAFAASAVPFLLATSPLPAQDGGGTSGPLSDSALVATLAVRSIGPAVMSGRVSDIAVATSAHARGGSLGTVIYVAAAGGGVWKSTNGAMSWTPVLDDAGVGSIGDVTVSASNSDIVWVGSGESNNLRSSSYGDGLYKSVDGGESFQHMGLRESQHIPRILIHPTDPNTVWVAAMGPLWAAGGQRGVYKTTDGGETWQAVLSVDQHTGATELVMDPTNPDVIYVATFQRERRAFSYVGGGPGSAIHKSTDGGETWTKLSTGLPTSQMGRIGLDISLSQPNTLYAVIEGSEGGVYRTDNGGASWRKANSISSIPWFFSQIRVDPTNPEVVYHLGVTLQRSEDGGENWSRIANQVHADNHAMWINPDNSHHMIVGNDGGLYVTRDYGETWDFSPNLPISQFYSIGVDMQEPFFGVYGGLQDNSTWGGPSRTRDQAGITNSDWIRMAGGDGFYAAVDPEDHNIAYVESQNGNILRFNRRTGGQKTIKPQPAVGDMPYRFNWSSPIKISPFDHETLYFAANHMFKSTNRGDSWTVLGGDLTQAIDRDSLEMMGGIPESGTVARHSGTARFGTITTISISTLEQGALAAGSDDGVVSVSRDDGQTWERTLSFPGVPDTTYVSKVRWSGHIAGRVYATFDGHRSNDFEPHVVRSDDYGASWTNISNNLPDFGNVRAFVEHPGNPNVVFVGTEVAPFVSVDGGGSWVRIRNMMPPVRIDDMVIHARENSLVIGTHGRGLYLLDDLTPLEHLAEAKSAEAPYLFPVQPAMTYTASRAATSGTHGERNYQGSNPAIGSTISYLLPEQISEDDFSLEIYGPNGAMIRVLKGSRSKGLHHMLWDHRIDEEYRGPGSSVRRASAPRGRFGGGTAGPTILPGTYSVKLTVASDDDSNSDDVVLEQTVLVQKDPSVLMTDAELRRLYDLRVEHRKLDARLAIALKQLDDLKEEVDEATEAMKKVEASPALTTSAESIKSEIDSIFAVLRGAGGRGGNPQPTPAPTVRQRLQLAGGVHRAMENATDLELEALRSVPSDLEAGVARINAVLIEALPAFRKALDAENVPWTSGRPVGS